MIEFTITWLGPVPKGVSEFWRPGNGDWHSIRIDQNGSRYYMAVNVKTWRRSGISDAPLERVKMTYRGAKVLQEKLRDAYKQFIAGQVLDVPQV